MYYKLVHTTYTSVPKSTPAWARGFVAEVKSRNRKLQQKKSAFHHEAVTFINGSGRRMKPELWSQLQHNTVASRAICAPARPTRKQFSLEMAQKMGWQLEKILHGEINQRKINWRACPWCLVMRSHTPADESWLLEISQTGWLAMVMGEIISKHGNCFDLFTGLAVTQPKWQFECYWRGNITAKTINNNF